MLSDGKIIDIAEDFESQYMHGGVTFDEFDSIGFARAIEREATAPLIEQIKQLSGQADRAVSVAEGLNEQINDHERKPLCWLQQDKFGNFHIADESWHGAFPVYGEPKV